MFCFCSHVSSNKGIYTHLQEYTVQKGSCAGSDQEVGKVMYRRGPSAESWRMSGGTGAVVDLLLFLDVNLCPLEG